MQVVDQSWNSFLQHISVAGERRYDTRSSSRSRKYSCCRRPVQGQMCSWNCKCLHFCCLLNNPWLDWYRWGIRFPRWPTATAKQTRRWSTMCCSVRLGESTGLPRRLLEVRTWAKEGKRRKRLIDRAAFNILCLSIMISVKKQKWYLKCFRPPWRGRLASWRSTPSSWCLSMTNTRFHIYHVLAMKIGITRTPCLWRTCAGRRSCW